MKLEIKGYNNRYSIDENGVIYSNGSKTHKAHIMKQHICDGYYYCSLWDGNKYRHCRVHRLVAEAFIPNPNNFPEVNHKDENRLNNTVSNLEWVSDEYNQNYGNHQKHSAESRKNHKSYSKVVFQINDDGKIINSFPSSREVERQLGYKASNIRIACLNNVKRYKYYWKYDN